MSVERKLYMLQMDAQGMAFRHRPHPQRLLDGRMQSAFGEFRESIEDLLVSKRIKHPPENKAIVERSTPKNNNMFVWASESVIEDIRERLKATGVGSVIALPMSAPFQPFSEPLSGIADASSPQV